MIKNKGRSHTYVGSVDNTAIGNQEIAIVRHEAKVFNAEQKLANLYDPTYVPKIRKVALFGRLGKNNPNAQKYRDQQRGSWHNAYQRITIADASTIDIYVTEYIKRSRSDGSAWYTANF
jgi:hypothetical protein